MAVNDVEIGRYGIDEFVGYVRFHAKEGGVQLRWITAKPLTPDATGDAVHLIGAKQVISPRIEREVKPDYTVEAMRGQIEGVVEVEAVVLIDGSVGPVLVVRPLDPGLDGQAVAAVRRWRFVPGARNGRLVPVMVNIVLTFKIK